MWRRVGESILWKFLLHITASNSIQINDDLYSWLQRQSTPFQHWHSIPWCRFATDTFNFSRSHLSKQLMKWTVCCSIKSFSLICHCDITSSLVICQIRDIRWLFLTLRERDAWVEFNWKCSDILAKSCENLSRVFIYARKFITSTRRFHVLTCFREVLQSAAGGWTFIASWSQLS